MNDRERSVVHYYIATKNLKKMGEKEDTDKSALLMVRIQRGIRKRLLYTRVRNIQNEKETETQRN